jgi:DNA polymerase III alpha subunit
MEMVLFPNSFQQTVGLWERDKVVLVKGKLNSRDKEGNPSGETKVMVDDAREITSQQAEAYQATGKKPKVPKARPTIKVNMPGPGAKAAKPVKPAIERVYIRLSNTNDEKTLMSLKQTIDSHQGETEVVLVLGEAAGKQAIKLPGGINKTSDGVAQLKELVGSDNLVIR